MRRRTPPHLYGDYAAQLDHFTQVRSDGCWEFTGYVMPQGYGQLGRNIGAHRLAWELAHGRRVPAGLVIDHLCHNSHPTCEDNSDCAHRRCVNPAHLEAVSSTINIMRGKGFGPANDSKTHCDSGHEFTIENTYYRPDRYGRICKTCRDETLAEGRSRWASAKRERAAMARRDANPIDFAIREWAINAGLACSMSGPISRSVRRAHQEAHAHQERRSA